MGATLKRLDTAEPVFTWFAADLSTILLYVFKACFRGYKDVSDGPRYNLPSHFLNCTS